MKTHKATAKRFKKRKSGTVNYRRSGKNHNRSKKSSARKRRLAKIGELFAAAKRNLLKRL